MLTILNPPKLEANPSVIVRTSPINKPFASENRNIPGEFARVSIKTVKDWHFIRLLQHGEDYFAPTHGDGLLVKANLLKA